MRKAIFLDRDGVINTKAAEHDYIKEWAEFVFLPGVAKAIGSLNKAGYLVIVVTNQRGIARGMMTMTDVEDIHTNMCAELEKCGAHIDAIYICPHKDAECNCRKPDIGLFLQAERALDIDKAASWMIGDSKTDIDAGKNFGIRTIYIGAKPTDADFSCGSLSEAASIIGGQA